MTLFRLVRSQKIAAGGVLLCVTLLSAWVLAGDALAWQPQVKAAPQTAERGQSAVAGAHIYEIRTYRIKPGMMDGWVKFMGEKLVPYQERMGMHHFGHWVAGKENTYVWIRTYPDEATQKRLNDEVHATAEWKQKIVPEVGQYIDKIDVIFTAPTYFSRAK